MAFIDLITSVEEGGAEFRLTEVNGEIAQTLSLKGHWNLGDNAAFGMFLDGTSASLVDINSHVRRFRMVTSGSYVGFKAFLNHPIQFNGNLAFGYGYAEAAGVAYDDYEFTDFWVVEPQMNASVKVLPIMKMTVGGGYRFAYGSWNSSLPNEMLSGPSIGAGLIFGDFRY